MTQKPHQRGGPSVDRRDFLRGSMLLALAAGSPALLAACGERTPSVSGSTGAEPQRDRALAPERSGDAAAVRRPAGRRLRPGARDRRHVPDLQLPRVQRAGRPEGLRQEVRREGRGDHLHHDVRGRRQAEARCHRLRRVLPDAGHPRQGRRRQAPPAGEPELHHRHEQRLAAAAEPVLRPGFAIHRALHGLHDRHHVPRGPGHARERPQRRLRHALGRGEQGQELHHRRQPRRPLHGHAARRDDR